VAEAVGDLRAATHGRRSRDALDVPYVRMYGIEVTG
jgi:hypothetical protein